MVVSLLVVGFIAWAMTGAVEDTIRAARGDAPAGPRKGFRGYLDDRWQALADRHHATKEAGLLTAGDAWAHKRHLARKKALARAGYRTDEDIARAAWHHRRRLALIDEGIDPDTVPPPPDAPALKRRRQQSEDPKEELDTTDVVGLTDLDEGPKDSYEEYGDIEPDIPTKVLDEAFSDPQGKQPWTPFTNPKENQMTAGEINNPADVKAFHAQLSASLDAAIQNTDALAELTTTLKNRAADQIADIMATETAAAGMDSLGMSDAAAAARALIEQQQQIEQALKAIVAAVEAGAAAITDAVAAARPGVNAIGRAYTAQLSVADTRAGVGRGNLAEDKFLDGDV